MGVINFLKTNCQNCYACVRTCHVKAIKIHKGQAEIIESKCIGCGLCLHECPKNAKEIQSELDQVKKHLKNKEKMAVSLAPSFISIFGSDSNRVVTLLKKLGFTYVEETIIGADIVTNEYIKYKENNLNLACITSCCPSVNLLIEKYYPQNIKNLIPIISPMECHAQILKQKYGEDTKVVFIGPCLSKKIEAENLKSIDVVLTFQELFNWIKEEKISISNLPITPFDATNEHYRNYPLVGGITQHFSKEKHFSVNGIDECISVLEAINQGKFQDYLIEMSSCNHSCIGGSAMPEDSLSVYERKVNLKSYSESILSHSDQNRFSLSNLNLKKDFYNLSIPLNQPDEEVLEKLLNSMGKYTKDDQLNCGYCGYSTCKEKAVAIFNEMAESNMCIPFLKHKAETIANILFDVTPNIVIIVDENLNIVEFNPAAETFFDYKKHELIDLPISIILNPNLFTEVKERKTNILGKKQVINQKHTIIQSIVWVDYHDVMLCVINDITESAKKEEWVKSLKINSFNMAQEVINKQMRVAQEIASLLGETTAETKVTLTRLKEIIKKEEVE